MTEWWTYRPADFLLFSPRTYYRLFELYNAAVWPAQLLTIGLGLALWWVCWQRRGYAPRAAGVMLAAAWWWVAWAFHWQRYSTINWAATWFAATFATQGVLLAAWALLAPAAHDRDALGGTRGIGLTLLLLSVVLTPAIGPLTGRPWAQVEVVGLAPDPTAQATLGVLLLLPAQGSRFPRWLLWPLPLLWCAYSGITLATMHAIDAFVLPGMAALALSTVLAARRGGRVT